MSPENDFGCFVCGKRLPTKTIKIEGYSDYGSGISYHTVYDTSSLDAYFVRIANKDVLEHPYRDYTNQKIAAEIIELEDDVNRNVLKEEYRKDVLNIRKPQISKKHGDEIEKFKGFLNDFGRPFQDTFYWTRFAVHGEEPACINKILELGNPKIKKHIGEEGKDEKMLIGEIILDVDTVLSKNIFPTLSSYFTPLKDYMKPVKDNMIIEFRHFSEFEK